METNNAPNMNSFFASWFLETNSANEGIEKKVKQRNRTNNSVVGGDGGIELFFIFVLVNHGVFQNYFPEQFGRCPKDASKLFIFPRSGRLFCEFREDQSVFFLPYIETPAYPPTYSSIYHMFVCLKAAHKAHPDGVLWPLFRKLSFWRNGHSN